MRIKLFESFENNDYYQETDYYEWLAAFGDRLYISDSLNNRIKNLFDSSFDHQKFGYLKKDSQGSVIFVDKLNYDLPTSISYEMKISLNDDEWYYVYVYTEDYIRRKTTYYKCDQFHGLEKLLKDKKII